MPELTLASYNIHWGRGPRGLDFPRFDIVAAARQLDADVLIIQESYAPDDGIADHQRIADALGMVVACDTALARCTPHPHPRVVGRATHRGGEGSWHLAALTRVPVPAASVIPLPHLPLDPVDRAVLAVEVEVDGATLHVRGTHLPHLEYGAHLTTRGLRRTLPPADQPGALIGDMNMWGWTIDRMVPKGWRRVVKGKTWPSHRAHSQIDHLLVTDSVAAVSSQVGPHLGSDHLPIRARLRW
ncbi:MAG TPA: endonuclease/exonuclease/phosphatase family protein [Acidimicrobiales bacterium]|nr:endonuclease/exonuclease/phosphatase family protein [Acidimicrobiales bacterium]